MNGGSAKISRSFQRLFALVSLLAWLSLASQVAVLVGSRGLLPMRDFFHGGNDLPFWDAPTLFWLSTNDRVIVGGTWLGAVLSLAALAGIAPRVMFALSTVLYLSYTVACRTFLAFQWDILLLECGLLSLFLPAHRPAPLGHLAFRLLAFKLYFESGLAKSGSPIGDWWDGSAMSFYYETAPIPTALGYTFHHLPAWWHSIESRATLALELVVPFFFFGPRKLRLAAFGLLTAFQLVNLATANYGFFVYLALALHVFLLDESDHVRMQMAVDTRLGRLTAPRILRSTVYGLRALKWRMRLPQLRLSTPRWLGYAALAVYCGLSLAQGLRSFSPLFRRNEFVADVADLGSAFRLVNTYHLFAEITRDRIEPEFQTYDGTTFTGHDLRYKPGNLVRAPPFIAPHQPRVDFSLWFYGLGYRQMPEYVYGLLGRMCTDPSAVQPLFAHPLPRDAAGVRVMFHRYHFASRAEHAESGAWWQKREIGTTRVLPCAGARK